MHCQTILYLVYVFFSDDSLEKHANPSSITFDIPVSGGVVFSSST